MFGKIENLLPYKVTNDVREICRSAQWDREDWISGLTLDLLVWI